MQFSQINKQKQNNLKIIHNYHSTVFLILKIILPNPPPTIPPLPTCLSPYTHSFFFSLVIYFLLLCHCIQTSLCSLHMHDLCSFTSNSLDPNQSYFGKPGKNCHRNHQDRLTKLEISLHLPLLFQQINRSTFKPL